MGFFKKAMGAATGIATGGMYSTSGGGLLQGGGLYGMMNTANGGLYDAIKGKNDKPDPNAGIDIYNNQLLNKAETDAAAKKKQYYGSTLDGLGAETQDYVSGLKANLGKNVAKADIYNTQMGQARGLAEARAGLQGIDNTALNEGARRRGSFEAAAINENAKREALDLYGKSISNRIEGANKIDNSEKALAIASMKQPQTNYKPGLIGSLFEGFI